MLVNFEDVPYGIKVEFVFGSCPALQISQTELSLPSLRNHVVIATSIVSRKKNLQEELSYPF